MMIDDDFEERLSAAFSKAERVRVPPLTPERKAMLRALVRPAQDGRAVLSLMWRIIADGVEEMLYVVKTKGLVVSPSSAPVFRGDAGGEAQVGVVSLPVQGGELRIQVIPCKNRKARLVLTAKGEFAERDDLSVELALGSRLLEARPLEQKAELSVDGVGAFNLSLYAGDDIVGSVVLDIGMAKGDGDA